MADFRSEGGSAIFEGCVWKSGNSDSGISATSRVGRAPTPSASASPVSWGVSAETGVRNLTVQAGRPGTSADHQPADFGPAGGPATLRRMSGNSDFEISAAGRLGTWRRVFRRRRRLFPREFRPKSGPRTRQRVLGGQSPDFGCDLLTSRPTSVRPADLRYLRGVPENSDFEISVTDRRLSRGAVLGVAAACFLVCFGRHRAPELHGPGGPARAQISGATCSLIGRFSAGRGTERARPAAGVARGQFSCPVAIIGKILLAREVK